ncbi:hypothetical protein [Bradyrhizobium cenepequi]|uniref:hypothetical protein n=1 Tax=Bradyrhizobium cenepequi TaxID=2821403 RepID=UPI001CE39F43|nr:hypothetical protein [Bradyrhizobium cenepequi]MCA6111576.1 hypothetical protein [Bradyrhizobium cenepequi]
MKRVKKNGHLGRTGNVLAFKRQSGSKKRITTMKRRALKVRKSGRLRPSIILTAPITRSTVLKDRWQNGFLPILAGHQCQSGIDPSEVGIGLARGGSSRDAHHGCDISRGLAIELNDSTWTAEKRDTDRHNKAMRFGGSKSLSSRVAYHHDGKRLRARQFFRIRWQTGSSAVSP